MQGSINNIMADKKFINLHESYMRRYERGGFLVGDCFKFNDNFKSTDEFKALGSNTQELLQQMIDSGINVRVVGISTKSTNSLSKLEASGPELIIPPPP